MWTDCVDSLHRSRWRSWEGKSKVEHGKKGELLEVAVFLFVFIFHHFILTDKKLNQFFPS